MGKLEIIEKKKQRTLEDYFETVETSANSIENKLARIFDDVQDVIAQMKGIEVELKKMREVHG
ncbi:MAG: hypothetical protein ACTSUK_07220 [Promethearchaeota archaeon]